MSQKAKQAIDESQVIAGYITYIRLLGKLAKEKEIIASGMTQEISRARQVIELALAGKKVCLISSGDPGIYGMAGVVLELLNSGQAGKFDLEIIPGITSASSCASLLGAPLAQDFAMISLSDLLVSRKEIEKKLLFSLKADFVIALYNPQSKTRTKPLEQAWKMIAKFRPAKTPVGIVKDAYRLGQEVIIKPLRQAARIKDIDMATTIIIGNSRTLIKNGYMITPRGYLNRDSDHFSSTQTKKNGRCPSKQ